MILLIQFIQFDFVHFGFYRPPKNGIHPMLRKFYERPGRRHMVVCPSSLSLNSKKIDPFQQIKTWVSQAEHVMNHGLFVEMETRYIFWNSFSWYPKKRSTGWLILQNAHHLFRTQTLAKANCWAELAEILHATLSDAGGGEAKIFLATF